MSFVPISLNPNSRGGNYAPTPGHDVVPNPRMVEWKIDWKTPTKMVALLFAGIGAAIGHHYYYQSLDGTEVSTSGSNKNSQEWQLRYGTAFAFLTKSLLVASATKAYEQHIWTTMRKKSIKISGLDATFDAISDPLSFFSWSFWKNFKVGVVIAAIAWMMPLPVLVPPAALTVVPSTTIDPRPMTVPMVNYTDVSSLFVLSNTNVDVDTNTIDNGITPFFTRLMAATASSMEVLPMVAFVPASSYSVYFSAPTFSCENAPDNVTTVIDQVANYTKPVTGDREISFLAFTPQGEMLVDSGSNYNEYPQFVDSCVSSTAGVDGRFFFCYGIVALEMNATESSLYIWVKSDDNYYSCELKETHFNVTFNTTGDIQTVNHPYSFEYTGQDLKPGYYVHGQAMTNLLSGAVWGMFDGQVSVRTRITQSSLYAALKTNGQNFSSAGIHEGIPEASISAAEKALTRGLTMGQLIEELSRNLTLSLFSADRTLSPLGFDTTVNVAVSANIYAYNAVNLAAAYAVAIAASMLCVCVGLRALVVNGVSHGTSFSSIMCSTRNKTLDEITKGYSLGALPLDKSIKDTELKFGLFKETGNDQGTVKRVGFGLVSEVETLEKRVSCY